MPSFVPHFVVPVLFALAFLPVDRRRILAWGPIAWAPDLDFLIPGEHRAVTSSIFIPAALVVALVVVWRRRDPQARWWEFATRPGAPANLFLAAFFISSHILMDVFAGGVVLFWPVWDQNFYVAFEILLDTRTNTFSPAGVAGSSEGPPALAPLYPWLSTVDAAVLVFLAFAGAVAGLVWWQRCRYHRTPAVLERVATLAEPIHKR